jgi:hypothetical protein
MILFYLTSCDVVLQDGPEAQKPYFAQCASDFLSEIGMDSADQRAAKWEQAHQLYERFFALAAEIVAKHPGILA